MVLAQGGAGPGAVQKWYFLWVAASHSVASIPAGPSDMRGPPWVPILFPPRNQESDPTMTHNYSAFTSLISELLAEPDLAHEDVFRRMLQAGMQDLVDAEATAKIGAGRNERTPERATRRRPGGCSRRQHPFPTIPGPSAAARLTTPSLPCATVSDCDRGKPAAFTWVTLMPEGSFWSSAVASSVRAGWSPSAPASGSC